MSANKHRGHLLNEIFVYSKDITRSPGVQESSLVFTSDASTSASTSTRIKSFPFSCACGNAYVCAATSEKEIPLRHNTSTKIFTTRGYVWPMKALDPDYHAPKQFSKMAESSDDFAWVCVCVEFRFHLSHPYCLRLCLRLFLSSYLRR